MIDHDDLRYGVVERLLHRLAFRGVPVQLALADLEERLLGSNARALELGDPVFVASLPRCGTTLLLNVLTGTGQFASHRYSDMPFVLCPLLWSAFADCLRRIGPSRERAHADEMWIDSNSPESMEEVLWQAFWPDKYSEKQLPLWNATIQRDEFADFFASHMRKIASNWPLPTRTRIRYISKNNANIARIPFLRRTLLGAYVVVPFRDPLDHVSSLNRLHLKFGRLQRNDRFAREYMSYLGHFEFGELFRPIDFPVFGDGDSDRCAPGTEGFWLGYWCRGFGYALAQADERVLLVDYDELCKRPEASLRALCGRLNGVWSEQWASRAESIRPFRERVAASAAIPTAEEERARHLHAELRARAINAAS